MVDGLKFREWIEAESDDADNIFLMERPPVAGVEAVAPVVSHDEVFIVGQGCSDIAGGFSLKWQVGFRKSEGLPGLSRFSNGHLPVFDDYLFTGQADNAFNEKRRLVTGVAEDDYLASLRLTEDIGHFVNQEVVAVLEVRRHARPADEKRLNDKGSDDEYRNERNEDDLGDLPDTGEQFFH